MENSAPPKKRGPKARKIDRDQLAVLAGMQCTYEEIAAVFHLHKRQFINRLNREAALKQIVEDGWAAGRASIRRTQFTLLAQGNATMAVWLGKQYLGQRDQMAVTGEQGGPLEINASDELISRIAGIASRAGTQSTPEKPE